MQNSTALILVCISYLLGVIAGNLIFPAVIFVCLALIFIFCLVKKSLVGALVLAFLGFGLIRGSSAFEQTKTFNDFSGKNITARVKILDELRINGRSHLYKAGGTDFKYSIFTDEYLEPGQIVELSGILEAPEEKWKRYSYSIGEAGTISYPKITVISQSTTKESLADKIRSFTRNTLNENLDSDSSAFATGLLLGTKEELSKELKESLISTGTMHIIALSGYNITMIIGMMAVIFRVFPIRVRIAMSLITIFGFLSVVGFSPSVVRAAIMG